MPKAEVQRVLLNLEAQWLGDLGARLRRHGGTAVPVVQCNCNRLKNTITGIASKSARQRVRPFTQVNARNSISTMHPSPSGYGVARGTLIMGLVAPVMMDVLAVPVWIMLFNV